MPTVGVAHRDMLQATSYQTFIYLISSREGYTILMENSRNPASIHGRWEKDGVT